MIIKIFVQDPKNEIFQATWESKSEWRARYIRTKKGRYTCFKIIAKDTNSGRALANYIFRWLQAYEKLDKLL